MKIDFIKQPGGTLTPADDLEAEKMKRYKNGSIYPIEIKKTRNPDFHNKVFKFMRFCFAHWQGSNGYEFADESKQFDVFRNHLTALAGYYDQLFNINGDFRIEAKSLSYSNMDDAEFQECYSAMINAALKNIFLTTDKETRETLESFF